MQLSSQDFADIVATLQAVEAVVASDKRHFPRNPVSGQVVLTPLPDGQAGKPYTALTRDLSPQGAGILQSTAVAVAQSIRVNFPRKGKPPLGVLARVTHVRAAADGLYAVGCEFVAPADVA